MFGMNHNYYLKIILLVSIIGLILTIISSYIKPTSFYILIIKGIICFLISVIIVLLGYRNSEGIKLLKNKFKLERGNK